MRKKFYLFTLSVLFVTVTTMGQNSADEALDLLNANSSLTETVKGFDHAFLQELTDRGEPLVYDKNNSANFEYIGMPVGGIAAGQLYLGGDGKLWFWDIFNTNNYFNLKGEEAYEFPYKRSEAGRYGTLDIEQGFAIKVKSGLDSIVKTLDRDGITDIKFTGQYPVGTIRYSDDDLPVDVVLEAYSPFSPLDIDHSSYPATVFSFTINNTSSETVEVDLAGWLENAVSIQTRKILNGKLVNEIKSLTNGALQLESSAVLETDPEHAPEDNYDYGTMALTLLNSSTADGGSSSLSDADLLDEIFYSDDQIEELAFGSEKLIGSLSKSLKIAPGGEEKVHFVLSWHFKFSRVMMPDLGEMTIKYYNNRFKDAFEVANDITINFDDLSATTKLWKETWYNSTLPYWFLDRTFLNTSILASSTSHLFEDGTFYGFEGGYQGTGTCTHVWGYVQAMGRLFPQLEKNLREKTDFVAFPEGGLQSSSGIVEFRGRYGRGLAVDGQSGIIMRSYLAHLMSSDNAFLETNYEDIKFVMNGLIEARDADHDGILTGAQHNTLDADWYGKITWLSLYYDAALMAMASMADEMADTEYATFCRQTSLKGREYIEEYLFNGDYFYHEGDPQKPDSPGVYTGCEYSQLLGQSWARQLGLGDLLNSEKLKTALLSIWKYNFSTDVGPFREVHPDGRWYAMPGEGGVIACTWPFGGSEVLSNGNPRFAAYNNESQNGYEYAYSSTLMYYDMPELSLAHIWYMHNNRYHGSKRNPWCEIEWGLHYSRSMASYGHFVGVSGFEYHGPKGFIAFSPKIDMDDFKAPFVTAGGWGTFSQLRDDSFQEELLELKHGSLQLNTLAFDIPEGKIVSTVDLTLDGGTISSGFKLINETRVNITLSESASLSKDDLLHVSINYSDGGNSSPYNSRHMIPGVIEAEDFDNGGEGVAYHDSDDLNSGGQYRADEAVDIQSFSEGAYNVGDLNSNEWMKYSVNVKEDGIYKISLRLAADNDEGRLHIFSDKVDLCRTIKVPATSGLQNYQTIEEVVALSAGEQVMKVYIEKGGFNINWLEITWLKDALPHPWINENVGGEAKAGRASYSFGGSFTIIDSLADIGSASDNFHYVYQQISGDKYILGAVDSIPALPSCIASGFMFRESSNDNSKFVFLYKSMDNNISLQWRNTIAGEAQVADYELGGILSSTLLKLEKNGTEYIAYYSNNGIDFTELQKVDCDLGDTPLLGLANSSCNHTENTVFHFSRISVLPVIKKQEVHFIRKANSRGVALDGDNGGSNGQNVYLWSYASWNDNQKWLEIDRGDGFFSYQKLGTDYCIEGSSEGADNQDVYLWSCEDSNENQQWKKIPTELGSYRFQKRNAPGLFICAADGGANGQNVFLCEADEDDLNQHWLFDDDQLTITDMNHQIIKPLYFRVYPNPARDKLLISISSQVDPQALICIYDCTGLMRQSDKIADLDNMIDISGLSVGAYFMKVIDNQAIYITRFIKA